jgi:hypothetical protein
LLIIVFYSPFHILKYIKIDIKQDHFAVFAKKSCASRNLKRLKAAHTPAKRKIVLKAGSRAGKALAVVGDGTPLGEQRELLVSFRGSNKL